MGGHEKGKEVRNGQLAVCKKISGEDKHRRKKNNAQKN